MTHGLAPAQGVNDVTPHVVRWFRKKYRPETRAFLVCGWHMRASERRLLCPPPMLITVALCRRLAIDDRAQGVTEYAILIGAMALGVMAAWLATSERALDLFKSLDTGLGRLSRAPH